MKLKKIVSLALAGVLAVSMLAGCKNGTGSSDPTKEPVASDLTSAVIAAVTETNVTYTKSADLDKAIAEYLVKNGTDNANNITASDLNAIDENISAVAGINDTMPKKPTVKDLEELAKAVSATYVVVNNTTLDGASQEKAAESLAAKLDEKAEAFKDKTQNKVYTIEGETYRLTFTYTGSVSAFTTTDDMGAVSYYMVYTVTRTGSVAKI